MLCKVGIACDVGIRFTALVRQRPPETSITVPDMSLEASLIRNKAAAAISSGRLAARERCLW
jgi:hypothetical protein